MRVNLTNNEDGRVREDNKQVKEISYGICSICSERRKGLQSFKVW